MTQQHPARSALHGQGCRQLLVTSTTETFDFDFAPAHAMWTLHECWLRGDVWAPVGLRAIDHCGRICSKHRDPQHQHQSKHLRRAQERHSKDGYADRLLSKHIESFQTMSLLSSQLHSETGMSAAHLWEVDTLFFLHYSWQTFLPLQLDSDQSTQGIALSDIEQHRETSDNLKAFRVWAVIVAHSF